MSSLRIRPRFIISSSYSPEEIVNKIDINLKKEFTPYYAESLLTNFIVIKIKDSDRKLWSPQLSISIEKNDDGCLLRGLYAPKPSLWSLFMFLYIGIGVGVIFTGLYGLARHSLNMDAPILWLVPALLVLAFVLYLFAQAGQKLSAQQMFDIHHFFEDSIERKARIY